MKPEIKFSETPFVRIPEAAKFLDVCPKTVYRMLARGELAYKKVRGSIRIPKAALLKFVECEG